MWLHQTVILFFFLILAFSVPTLLFCPFSCVCTWSHDPLTSTAACACAQTCYQGNGSAGCIWENKRAVSTGSPGTVLAAFLIFFNTVLWLDTGPCGPESDLELSRFSRISRSGPGLHHHRFYSVDWMVSTTLWRSDRDKKLRHGTLTRTLERSIAHYRWL